MGFPSWTLLPVKVVTLSSCLGLGRPVQKAEVSLGSNCHLGSLSNSLSEGINFKKRIKTEIPHFPPAVVMRAVIKSPAMGYVVLR